MNQDIYALRCEFWEQLIQSMNGTQSILYKRFTSSRAYWISARSSVDGVEFIFSATKHYGRAELFITRDEKEENELIFGLLHSQKDKIETAFGGSLEWERLKKTCRIKAEQEGNISDHDQWQTMTEFMIDAMCRLETAINEPLRQVAKQIGDG